MAGQAQDWFSANAPAPAPSGDWFATNSPSAQPQFTPPPGTPGVPRPQVNMREESIPEAVGGNDLEQFGNAASEYASQFGNRVRSNLQGAADAVDNVVKNPEELGRALSVKTPRSADNLVQNVKADIPDYGLNRDTLVKAPADIATGALADMPESKEPAPFNDVTRGKYSRPADYLASSLRSNARIDVPAEAHIAHDAIAEGLADRGFTARDFQGRNGPTVLQSGIDNALRIQQARAESVLAPIRADAVDPQLLQKNPELANQPEIANKIANKKPVTYNDVDAARVRMNKYLRRTNFYAKDPTMQVAMDLEMEDAVNQARDVLYDHAEQKTGVDLQPMKRTESALLKLKDLSSVTGNTLVSKDARFQSESAATKIGTKVKGIASITSNPISSFFSYEKMGSSPLDEFNGNMQKSFKGVRPAKADLSVSLPRYNLQLEPPAGRVPPAIQQDLNFNGADQEPEPPKGGNGNGERRVTPRNGKTFTPEEREQFLQRMSEADRGVNPNPGVKNPFENHPSHMETVRRFEAAQDVLSGRKPRGGSIR